MKDGPIAGKRSGGELLKASRNHKKPRIQSPYKSVAAKIISCHLFSYRNELSWDNSRIEEPTETIQITALSATADDQPHRQL